MVHRCHVKREKGEFLFNPKGELTYGFAMVSSSELFEIEGGRAPINLSCNDKQRRHK